MSGSGSHPMFGPGSQPHDPDGATLDYVEMPSGMSTYRTPEIPEPEELDDCQRGLEVLSQVQKALASHRVSDPAQVFDLAGLGTGDKALIDQVMGEGEVSAIAGSTSQVQESVLTGVWRVHITNEDGGLVSDLIEVASFPQAVLDVARRGAAPTPPVNLEPLPAGVANSPAILTELDDAVTAFTPDSLPHVVNLSLLPLSDEDVAYLDERLQTGAVTILSRGYGNCRITSTGTANVWWVQYFNSNDAMILNTIEVTSIPEVACAAQEDIDDSAQRLGEILEVYR
jgi:hydrogenase-1 operon protein HyaF